MILCSGITPGGDQGVVWTIEDGTKVFYVQGKPPHPLAVLSLCFPHWYSRGEGTGAKRVGAHRLVLTLCSGVTPGGSRLSNRAHSTCTAFVYLPWGAISLLFQFFS